LKFIKEGGPRHQGLTPRRVPFRPVRLVVHRKPMSDRAPLGENLPWCELSAGGTARGSSKF